MSYIGRVIIYGGAGLLGSRCVSHFKTNNFWVGSIDIEENSEADLNVILNNNDTLKQQENVILASITSYLQDCKLDGVFCVSGGWTSGGIQKDLIKNMEFMWKMNICPSILSTTIAVRYLKENGVLVFTGSRTGLKPCPNLLAYGLSKNAVHYLSKSLISVKDNGLPMGTIVVTILNNILDIPIGKEVMPNADIRTWLQLEYIADVFFKWTLGEEKPTSNIVQFVTNESRGTTMEIPKNDFFKPEEITYIDIPDLKI